MPVFDGSNLEGWARDFLRWLRVTALQDSDPQLRMDWVIQSSTPKVRHLLEKLTESHPTWEEFLDNLNGLFPKLETDFSLREKLQKLALLPKDPTPSQLEVMLLEMESLKARMPQSHSANERSSSS